MPATVCGVSLTVSVGGVDVSCDAVSVDVSYGRLRLWDVPSASTCQVQLDAGDDHQPPTRGPIGASVTVALAYGTVARTIFTGTVQQRRVESRPGATPNGASAGDVTIVLDCVDAFEQLARVNRRAATTDTPAGAGDTVDERLGAWLDEAGWTDGRDLNPVEFTCPDYLVDGNVLAELMHTAAADGGDFYIAGDGTATYRSWAWRLTVDDVTAIFSDRLLFDWVPYSAVTYRDDLDEVQNRVTGVRVDSGVGGDPVPQTATNSSSISTYGERGDPLDALLLEDDAQVATRVAGVVTAAAQPNPRFDGIVIQPQARPSRMWPRVIPIDFGSLIATNRVYPDGSQVALYGNVIGQRWRITPTDATLTLSVSGTGTWDATRGPRAPIAVEKCLDGSVRIPPGLPCDMTSDVVIKDVDGGVLVTYPPGSLCECGVVFIPDGGVEICLDDGVTAVCTPLTDPRIDALLWFDVLEPGPDLIERIDGDAVEPLSGFVGTALDVIDPGDYDAINASGVGGPIGASHSDHVEATSLGAAWRFDFYLDVSDTTMDADTYLEIIDVDTLGVRLRSSPTDAIIQLVVWVVESGVRQLSGVLLDVPIDGWHHYVISWEAAATGIELVVFIDGVES